MPLYRDKLKANKELLNETEIREDFDELKWLILCPVWPSIAKDWTSRARIEGWPSKALVEQIVQEGCFVTVPAGNVCSSYIFYNAEKRLFQEGLSSHQKYCFILLKLLCFQTLEFEDRFNPLVIKHLFYHACGRVPSEYWQASPGACIMYMLAELHQCFVEGRLQHYFISSQNIIEDISRNKQSEIAGRLVLLRSQPILFLRKINEKLGYCSRGKRILDCVANDIMEFKASKNVKDSTIKVFVPCIVGLAKDNINCCYYEQGLKFLNEAFQNRLAVSTCDDTVLYHVFLQTSLSGLCTTTKVWFCAYADAQLADQLAHPLIKEAYGDFNLTAIGEHLPNDVAGLYAKAELPKYFVSHFDTFCHDFAAFLTFVGKVPEAIFVLHYCIDQYKARENGRHAFDDSTMFVVYSALYALCSRRKYETDFMDYVDDMGDIAIRLNSKFCLHSVGNIYLELKDDVNAERLECLELKAKTGITDGDDFVSACRSWPNRYILY